MITLFYYVACALALCSLGMTCWFAVYNEKLVGIAMSFVAFFVFIELILVRFL